MAALSIRIVLVLYKLRLEESPVYQSLKKLLEQPTLRAANVHLLICDNSPIACQVPADFVGEYHHDGSNPGLARSYNLALKLAAVAGDTWLMLLDQDTVLTAAYLDEVCEMAKQYVDEIGVIAVVPKLMERDIVQSPHFSLTTRQSGPMSPDFSGFSDEKLQVYNSGALIRVSRLLLIGGFPEDFWLDFLDHATFHLLCKDGGSVLVMRAKLQHELSTNASIKSWNRAYLKRHGNVLDAEHMYYSRYGTAEERKLYRMRLVRMIYGAVKHLRLPMAWQIMRTLVRTT